MLELLLRRWWVVLIRGLMAIALGVLAILWPAITLFTVLFVFGAFTVGDGVMALWLGFTARREGKVWGEMIALGILSIIVGAIAALWPAAMAEVLVYLIGFFAILRGLFEIAAAIQLRKVIEDEWVLIVGGVMSLLIGVILVAFPGEGALAMVLLIGAFMLFVGSMQVALALRLRHLHGRLSKTQEQHHEPT